MGKQRDVLEMIYPHSRAALEAIKSAASGAKQQENANPATGMAKFNSESEAEAAGLAPGTKVIINGVQGTWK